MNSSSSSKDLTLYARPLVELDKGASDLQSFLAILGRRWWIIFGVGLTVFTYQMFTDLRRLPVYQEQFQLLIQPPQQDITNPLEGAAQVLGGSTGGADYFATQAAILVSNRLLQPVLDKVYEKYPELNTQDFTYEELRERITIIQIDKGQIFEITYQDSDPDRVKFVLDKLASSYLQYTLEDQQIRNEQQLFFINQQLPVLEAKVETLQQEMLGIQRRNNFFDPQVQGGSVNQSLNEIVRKKEEVEIEIEQNKILAEQFQQQLELEESEAIALHNLSQSPQYNQLLARLNAIDMELAQNTSRFTDDYALIQELKEEREKLLPLIRQQSQGILGSATGNSPALAPESLAPNDIRANAINGLIEVKAKLATLEKQQQMLSTYEAQTRTELDDVSGVVTQFLDKQRQLNLATESLNRLLEARQALEIESSKRFIPWRLVSDPKVPTDPIDRFWNDLLGAIARGLIAGGAVGALVETLDRRYHSVDQLSKDVGQTVLGSIPYISELRKRVGFGKAKTLKTTTFLESFSVLFSSIFFLGKRQNCQSFVVTSANSGDGKSTVAFFTAVAAAKLGQKVLLIDGDRYFPQGKIWVNLGRATGQEVTDIPEAEELESSNDLDKLAPVSLMKNLDYFKTKDNAMDPDQLMSGGGLPLLLSQWQKVYNVIIIDTPPILGLSDSRLIASQTDGILLVVRMEKSNRDNVAKALEAINLSNLNLLGVVANALKQKVGSYDYYNVIIQG